MAGKNARKYILRKEPPKDNWQKYIVQVILQSNSYKEALDVVHKKTRTDTSDTSSLCSQLGRGKRKRKTISQPAVTANNLNDDDSNPRMTPPPFIDLINGDNQDLDEGVENMDETAINVGQNKEDIASEGHVTLEDSQNIISILQNTIAIKKLLGQQNTFLAQLERTSNPLPSLLSASAGSSCSTFSLIPNKPFKKFTKLLDFDIALKNNQEGKKQMETFFYLLGGTSSHDQIKAGLEKIFTNKLGTKCSWMGRKGNFEVNTLIIMDILKQSTRKHFPFLTDKEFQNYVSVWLRHSKTRYNRELAKQQPRQ